MNTGIPSHETDSAAKTQDFAKEEIETEQGSINQVDKN